MALTSASRSTTLQLTCDLAAPRTARRLVALLLPQWGVADPDVLDAAVLVVSELVTNALVHCDDGGPVTLLLALHDEHLRIGVEDRAPTVPAQRVAAAADESGRGLDIVAQLAERWDVEPVDEGKRVVVDLPLAKADCA